METNNTNIELRLADLAGEMKVISSELKNLSKAVEKDVNNVKDELLRMQKDNDQELRASKIALDLVDAKVGLADLRIAKLENKQSWLTGALALGGVLFAAVIGIVAAFIQAYPVH